MTQQTINLILTCGVLGMCGQIFRMIIGMYKLVYQNKGAVKFNTLLNIQRLVVSLILGFSIGCLSAAIYSFPLSKSDILTLIAIGYSGTDTVEGIFQASLLMPTK
jgi:hypothetical protein